MQAAAIVMVMATLGVADVTNLQNNILVQAHVEEGQTNLNVPGSTLYFQIDIPPDSEVLEVRVGMAAGDADLFVGPTLSSDPNLYPFASFQDGTATEGVQVGRGSSPSVSSAQTWYIAVHGFLATDFILLASWGKADPASPLLNGGPVTDHVITGLDILVFPGSTRYYAVSLEPGVETLDISLAGFTGDGDLFLGRTLSADPGDYDFFSAQDGNLDEAIRLDTTTDPPIAASQVWYIAVHGFQETDYTLTASWTVPAAGPVFLRGDCNGDGGFDISDAVAALNGLFLGGAAPLCLAACDSNGDGVHDISDPVVSLAHLFLGGPAPPAPFPACGSPAALPALSCLASPCR
jgi:hypothetical protein